MPNNLPLPPELQHLIEKRSGDERREGTENTNDAPATDGTEPLRTADRRQEIRREENR